MNYITGENRHQTTFLPLTLDEYIHPDNPVRFIDAYVESLDMGKLGFTHARLSATGRPPYRPQDLLKLYMYGYLHKIRSSRALERETHRNMELLWLLGRLQPDFKTIADFRKNNPGPLKAVCGEFILLCKQMELFGGELIAIDGSKFEAVNHSSRSYTRKGLQQALTVIGKQLEKWLEQLDQADGQQQGEACVELLAEKITQLEARRAELEALREQMGQTEQTGVSLTDPDSRKMRTGHGGHDMCYNVQIATDSKYKLIVAHQVSNQQNDLHQLLPMARHAKQVLGIDHLEVTADAGYYHEQDIINCEQEHITCYVPSPVYAGQKSSEIFTKAEFTYQCELDAYLCPAGQVLPYKSTVNIRGKRTRIYETSACQRCPLRSRCTTAKKGNRRVYRWIHEGVLAAVKERVHQHPGKVKLRGQLVEHPFGTLKRAMGHSYFLTKGIERVSGEMSLSVLTYNLKRVLNIVGIDRLMEAVMGMKKPVLCFLIPFFGKCRRKCLLSHFITPISRKSLC